MNKGRLEAFSDGVIAILITIMVLELKTPEGVTSHALVPRVPILLMYVLTFVFLGIYWNNHHHLLQATERVNGRILHVAPEYDDCRKLAVEKNVPLQRVISEALRAYEKAGKTN